VGQPPIVPDVFVSLDVETPQDFRQKRNRTYFVWEFGKAPDVVIEVVSSREGNELGRKLHDYARLGVPYYVHLAAVVRPGGQPSTHRSRTGGAGAITG
jgi:Uma2 family endonuclease